jgi:predicted outer membrane repeat protein
MVPAAHAQNPGFKYVDVCDEGHLLAALAGGGDVAITCSGTITLTKTITITADTLIQGMGKVTISGNNQVRVFLVNAGSLQLTSLTVANGYVDPCSTTPQGAGFLLTGGSLWLQNSTLSGNNTLTGAAIYSSNNYVGVAESVISGNHQTDCGSTKAQGAGIYLNGGELYTRDSTFSDNTNDGSGGGIYNNGGTLTIEHTAFGGDNATRGGAIYNNAGTLTVTNSTFDGNTAADTGAAIANTGVASVDGSIFRDNRVSSRGGAIWNYTGGRLTVSNSAFSNNSAADYGGGIANDSGGTATVNSSTFSGNSGYTGGGIANRGLSTLTVSSSTFDGNHAISGGGIDSDCTLTVSNSTFSQNSADGNGGGIAQVYGDATVYNSTFSGNGAASNGGAIFAGAAVFRLANTIVANSTAGGNCSGPIVDRGGNLNYPDLSRKNCPGVLGDPLLGPLQDNGGPTLTMALAPGSPAIDAADDAICAAAPVNNLDQRGATRPSGLHCDIGAVEQQPTAGPPILIDIKPGSDPNSINCRNSNAVIAVALLTTDLFDATTVDHTTVTFHGAAETHVDRRTGAPISHEVDVDHQSGAPIRHEEDVDGDGDMDLVFHFRLGSTTLTCQSTVGALWAKTFAGESIVGTDAVSMVWPTGR